MAPSIIRQREIEEFETAIQRVGEAFLVAGPLGAARPTDFAADVGELFQQRQLVPAPSGMMDARRSIREVGVPTVHRFGPYQFWFFSGENQATNEPEHIHVESGDGWAIFWLRPVSVRDHRGYNPRELHRIRRIVTANREQLLRQWHEFFGQPT